MSNLPLLCCVIALVAYPLVWVSVEAVHMMFGQEPAREKTWMMTICFIVFMSMSFIFYALSKIFDIMGEGKPFLAIAGIAFLADYIIARVILRHQHAVDPDEYEKATALFK